ncbi:MAG TPA: THUMP domain-containing protein, partial [Geobacteraceae bacterium]|nr:THUMP domain-containing protein [Geobacteraceae bacterium]
MEFFATAAKGTEELLAAELAALGVAGIIAETGGARFTGDMSDCYRANLWLSTASRVLMPLKVFPCDTPGSLYEGVRTVPWHDFLSPQMTLAVECNLRD